jgi:hypothetical protein
MNMKEEALQTLLKQWTGATQFELVETSVFEKLIQAHPFSPSSDLVLAKKYQLDKSPLFETQLQKTTCFFPSALHVNQWMHTNVPDNTQKAPEKLSSLISEQLAQFQEPVKEANLSFEHEEHPTLQKDYFAAQGIDIDLSKVPQDKFTKQLRSFTAWLKVLKHADIEQNTPEIVEEQEKLISAIAEKANKAEDVITESMAEIWAKQGNKRKAIDTYSKLSFIFPEKSVYFASRIEQLKQKK